MRNHNDFSFLNIPCLLGMAAVLGAFAPIPLTSDTANDDGIRLPIASVSDMEVAQDDASMPNDSASNGDANDNGGMAAPNNTAANQGDQSSHAVTADQAGNKSADRDLMQKIRKAVIADQSLSTDAHNVKIIARHGKVTLKGPVDSDQEKQSVEAKAIEVAGNGKVVDRLTVKAD